MHGECTAAAHGTRAKSLACLPSRRPASQHDGPGQAVVERDGLPARVQGGGAGRLPALWAARRERAHPQGKLERVVAWPSIVQGTQLTATGCGVCAPTCRPARCAGLFPLLAACLAGRRLRPHCGAAHGRRHVREHNGPGGRAGGVPTQLAGRRAACRRRPCLPRACTVAALNFAVSARLAAALQPLGLYFGGRIRHHRRLDVGAGRLGGW